jgi:hypothetical protein
MNKLKALVKSLNGTIHNNSTAKVHDYGIEAPQGYVWAATSTHEMILHWFKGNQAWDNVQDAIERVTLGIVPCDDEDCEWCEKGE